MREPVRKHHFEELVIDGGIIFLSVLEKPWNLDWINLAQVRDKLQAVVNTVMNFQVP